MVKQKFQTPFHPIEEDGCIFSAGPLLAQSEKVAVLAQHWRCREAMGMMVAGVGRAKPIHRCQF
jgi:hypothetical protein